MYLTFFRTEKTVYYDEDHWTLLNRYRDAAIALMKVLENHNLIPALYGSVARGDVHLHSDIDIILPKPVSSTRVELALYAQNISIFQRRIAIATPNHTPKAHIFLDPMYHQCISFPLMPLRSLESEFYKFGGLVSLKDLISGIRVPGCDKRLMLIQPIEDGHVESSIQGRESEAAKIIGTKLEIVQERVRVLTRREKIGRTGIVLSRDLRDYEVFEEVLKKLADTNPLVKKHVRRKK